MNNTELTLDQPSEVAGGATAIEYGLIADFVPLRIRKTIRRKWMQNKKSVSRFIDDLDYNNQIQSSYDLILLGRQYKNNQ